MPTVSLQSLTADNWKACIALRLPSSQESFLPSNLYSIAEAQFYPDACPRAVDAQGQLVGFVLYGHDMQSGYWKLFRLMIDHTQQGRGYGTAALQAVITELAARPDCDRILVSYQRENAPARRLYQRFGFVEYAQEQGKADAVLMLPALRNVIQEYIQLYGGNR